MIHQQLSVASRLRSHRLSSSSSSFSSSSSNCFPIRPRTTTRTRTRRSFFPIALAFFSLTFNTVAQHIHIQTSYSPTAGWDIFWYDFDAGAFPANFFTQPVNKFARGQIPNDPALTNALGAAGNPVWTLPQVETSELPSLGFGTQGSGSFVGGQIQLRLATFSGPGHLAISQPARSARRM